MRCSIIVVAKNNVEDVRYTLDSLTCDDILEHCEVLVVDDSDNLLISSAIENDYCRYPVQYISGDGMSLFSAMNIGINASVGEYLWFLNSGDRRAPEFTKFDLGAMHCDLIYGNTRYKREDGSTFEVNRPKFNLSETNELRNSLPCHQSIFFKRTFLQGAKIKYNLGIPVSADYDFIYKCIENGASVLYFPVMVCEFSLGGISTKYKNFKQLIMHAKGIKITRKLKFSQYCILILKLSRKLF
mgnify:CR=1 FL=1